MIQTHQDVPDELTLPEEVKLEDWGKVAGKATRFVQKKSSETVFPPKSILPIEIYRVFEDSQLDVWVKLPRCVPKVCDLTLRSPVGLSLK